jgi:hypothetical protein
MPGVTIGRGAVIGANTVVTRDIAPYEVHGGAPNEKLGLRLNFTPPSRIQACNDHHIPYFYSGFQLKQGALSESRATGVIAAGRRSTMILSRTDGPIFIHGRVPQGAAVQLKTRVNGTGWQTHNLIEDKFTISATAVGEQTAPVASFLRSHSVLELHADLPSSNPVFGVAGAECG